MKKYLPFLLLAFGLLPTFAQAQWVARTGAPNADRSGSYAFVINGVAYVGGGDQASDSRKDLWAYDPTTDTWSQRADLPGPGRATAAVFVIGNTAYVVGGRSVSIFQALSLNDVWAYDPATDTWTARAPLPAIGRMGSYAFAIGGLGYVGGGTNINNVRQQTDFWAYDPVADNWTARTAPPTFANTLGAGFALGSFGYLAGGCSFDSTRFSRRVWRYDPTTDQWSRRANLPGPRAHVSSFTYGGYAYAVEGLSAINNQVPTLDMLRFDPAADTWTAIATPGIGRISPHSFALNGNAYVGGGLEAGGPTFFNDLWMLPNLITGVAPALENAALTLSPNPAHATARLTLPAPAPQAELLDALGRVVRRVALPADQRATDLDLTGLPPGLYSVRAGGLTRRLMVE